MAAELRVLEPLASTSTFSTTCSSSRLDRQGSRERWRLAREAAAGLTDTFLDGGVDAVLVEGRFFAKERAEYRAALRTDVVPRFVTLRVSYDEALRRAQTDATRGASRDPAFLRPYFMRVEREMEAIPASDLVLDTEQLDLHGVCDRSPWADSKGELGWPTGLEPVTSGATIQCSAG